MSAKITAYVDGELQTYTGATIPLIVHRVWGEGAELRKRQIIRRLPQDRTDWEVLAQVEEVVPADHRATLEDVRRAQAVLEGFEADVSRMRAERDALIRGAVESGETMYAVAQTLGLSQTAVAKIVRRG